MKQDKPRVDIKTLGVLALLLTIFLLLTVLVIAHLLNSARRDVVSDEIQATYNGLGEMQTFLLMSETYGSDMACIAFTEKIRALDSTVWNLGIRLDQYRIATEDLRKSEFYAEQKKTFNEQQVLYMLLVRNLQKRCNYNQSVIAYFYQNSDDCRKCDDQAFVLTDVNRVFDQEVSIFSYDADLNLTSVSLFMRYYNVSELPCVIINDVPHCGIQDRDFIVERICADTPASASCLAWQSGAVQFSGSEASE